MKQLLLIRHAKSSWSNPGLEDIDRPLGERGKIDAPFMAKYCESLGLYIDQLISSPAKRAYKTAKKFHKLHATSKVIIKETDLYFGDMEDWLHIINELEENVQLPAFFSHNPTITYFANAFQGSTTDNVPTCGIVRLESSVSKWSELHYNNTNVGAFYFPKEIRAKE